MVTMQVLPTQTSVHHAADVFEKEKYIHIQITLGFKTHNGQTDSFQPCAFLSQIDH